MRVKHSETIHDRYTVFRVDGEIPKNTYSVVIDGKPHDLLPAYGYDTQMMAIKGKYELTDKSVEFSGKRR